jgi:hypothetical protein
VSFLELFYITAANVFLLSFFLAGPGWRWAVPHRQPTDMTCQSVPATVQIPFILFFLLLFVFHSKRS